MSVKLYSLGAAEEVTGSCHILEIDGKKYMIDCGMFQGKRIVSDEKNKENPPVDINCLILTHAHLDHCGKIPVICRNGFDNKIYSTSATRDLSLIVMYDSAKIQANDIRILKKERKKNKKPAFKKEPLYTEKDCQKAMKQFRTVQYQNKTHIDDTIDLTFYDAGHILGSSFASIDIKNQKQNFINKLFKRDNSLNILFTGDLGRPNRPIIHNPTTSVGAPDYIVLESTYGNRKHESIDFAIDELAKIVNETSKNNGKLIIPCFAIERTQEVLYYLHMLSNQNKIPKRIPIYVDSPMASNATQIFNIHQECYNTDLKKQFLDNGKNPFSFGQLSFVDTMKESKMLDKIEGPMIIISANGMMEQGRVVYHVAAALEDPKNTILIVGYMAENTLGRKIRDGEKVVNIFETNYKVNAKIETINAFSAHADYEETLAWLKSIDTSHLKKIFLVHGEHDAQTFLKEHLRKNGFKNVEIVSKGKEYNLK